MGVKREFGRVLVIVGQLVFCRVAGDHDFTLFGEIHGG
jgi:hypothetical protein